jgi:dsRNA-specific ribonuclease
VQLTVRGDVLGVGMGRTKKEAEQMAAKQALAETSSKH